MSPASAVAKTSHSLRIIALPLTRSRPPGVQNHGRGERPSLQKTLLTYYQFQVRLPPDPNAKPKQQGSLARWTSWAQNKAADTWSGFGKAKEGSWKLRLFQYGERVLDRIDFEELALKGVDPSLGPSITKLNFSQGAGDEKIQRSMKIPLIYPHGVRPLTSNDTLAFSPLDHLRELLDHRGPRHRKGFYIWAFITPLTIPFTLVPVIPNFPFFFCVWRAWSHWRAYKASEYLLSLLDTGAVVPEESKLLGRIYAKYAQSACEKIIPISLEENKDMDTHFEPLPRKDSPFYSSPLSKLLLTREAVPDIVSAFRLLPSTDAELYRALEQAKLRLEKEKS